MHTFQREKKAYASIRTSVIKVMDICTSPNLIHYTYIHGVIPANENLQKKDEKRDQFFPPEIQR